MDRHYIERRHDGRTSHREEKMDHDSIGAPATMAQLSDIDEGMATHHGEVVLDIGVGDGSGFSSVGVKTVQGGSSSGVVMARGGSSSMGDDSGEAGSFLGAVSARGGSSFMGATVVWGSSSSMVTTMWGRSSSMGVTALRLQDDIDFDCGGQHQCWWWRMASEGDGDRRGT